MIDPKLVVAGLFLVVAVVAGMAAMDQEQTERKLVFQEVGSEVGLDYNVDVTQISMRGGGGTYISDYNNDGWPDVLTIGGSPGPVRSNPNRPALYVNDNGSFSWSRALPKEVLKGRLFMGALFFDYDNDGWDDLLLLADDEPPILLQNNHGQFRRADAGFKKPLPEPIGAAAADYNHDGCLDLFVIQNGDWSDEVPKGLESPNQRIENDNGNPNALYEGNCDGFERSSDAGINGSRWSLATSFVDLNDDKYPDIHVANDYNHDYVYLNRRNGTFRQVTLGKSTNRNGMSSEIFDVNHDGTPDIFVTNIYFDLKNITTDQLRDLLRNRLGHRADAGNTLLVNRGNGTFTDRAEFYNLRRGGWGWAAIAADFDNDRDLDLFHTAQRVSTNNVEFGTGSQFLKYPMLYERDGEKFVARNSSRLGFQITDGLGTASLDFDRDGDIDIIIGENDQGSFTLYENTGEGNNWLQVRLLNNSGVSSFGAEVTLTANGRSQTRRVHSRSDFVSQDSRVLHFGLGRHSTVSTLRVEWPNGRSAVFSDVSANQRVAIYGNGTMQVVSDEG